MTCCMWVGTDKFLSHVMEAFKRRLKVSRDDSVAFKYLGLNMKHTEDHIKLDQTDYLKAMKQDLLPKESMKDKYRFADEEEISLFRLGVGQLGWLSR